MITVVAAGLCHVDCWAVLQLNPVDALLSLRNAIGVDDLKSLGSDLIACFYLIISTTTYSETSLCGMPLFLANTDYAGNIRFTTRHHEIKVYGSTVLQAGPDTYVYAELTYLLLHDFGFSPVLQNHLSKRGAVMSCFIDHDCVDCDVHRIIQ